VARRKSLNAVPCSPPAQGWLSGPGLRVRIGSHLRASLDDLPGRVLMLWRERSANDGQTHGSRAPRRGTGSAHKQAPADQQDLPRGPSARGPGR
jgi:hypothetical protein